VVSGRKKCTGLNHIMLIGNAPQILFWGAFLIIGTGYGLTTS
jgi:hypothetical protein